jgi:hypothetical protein
MTLSLMTLRIMGIFVIVSMNDSHADCYVSYTVCRIFIVMLSAVMLNVNRQSFIMLNVDMQFGYVECRYAGCGYYADCPLAECPLAEFYYAECHYAECRHAESLF